MSRFTTVEITEAECLPGGKFISAKAVAMCRKFSSAMEVAQKEVNRKLAKQSIYGGVPILRIVTVNGKTVSY